MFVIINNVGIKINEWCECEELTDKGVCDKAFIWNPSNCECACDKTWDIGEYLDYENCKCRKKLVDEFTENIEEVKLAKISLAENENNYKCSSCTVHIMLFWIVFTIFTGITTYFIYYNWSLIKNSSFIKFGFRKETKIR